MPEKPAIPMAISTAEERKDAASMMSTGILSIFLTEHLETS